jgi:hypothetical protein
MRINPFTSIALNNAVWILIAIARLFKRQGMSDVDAVVCAVNAVQENLKAICGIVSCFHLIPLSKNGVNRPEIIKV